MIEMFESYNCIKCPQKTTWQLPLHFFMYFNAEMQLIYLKMDDNVADNDYMNLIAFGDEPTFVEEFGTFTANLPSEIKFCLPFFSSPTIF